MSDWILYDVEDGVCTITINRPEKKNAMGFAMLGDFIATFDRAGKDDDVRVVVLKGTDGAFCAGTDLSDLSSIPGEERGLRQITHARKNTRLTAAPPLESRRTVWKSPNIWRILS